MIILLAAVHPGEGSLISLAAAEYWPPDPISLRQYRLAGDGRETVGWIVHYGLYGRGVSIWTWQQGAYREVFNQYLYGTGPVFQDVDGGSVMILYTPQYPGASLWPGWPYAFRWDGQSFRPALFPQLYDDFIGGTQRRLQAREPARSLDDDIRLRLFLGRALQLQGRTAEAMSEYEQVWAFYSASGQQCVCLDAATAVQDYYRALGSVGKILQAYSMLGEGLRQKRSFPDFAAGYANTERVEVIEAPRVIGEEGSLFLVSVRVSAIDLTQQGEVERQFVGTWRVRVTDQRCVLEDAAIRPE